MASAVMVLKGGGGIRAGGERRRWGEGGSHPSVPGHVDMPTMGTETKDSHVVSSCVLTHSL